MPFDDEDDSFVPKTGLKNFGSKKSIIDNITEKKEEQRKFFEKKVEGYENNQSANQNDAVSLAAKFKEIIADKTLKSNKTFALEGIEKEFLSNILKFSEKLNNDEDENEGIGSLYLISLLLKSTLFYRDRINELEYEIFNLKNNNSKIVIKNE